ncbi:MAG: phenylacetic acid degradation bifunctional protein PaaZ [Bacteroidota bacterium]|nr:phenylacetic acid degradation bifunctional protein PaaZ [Bacteroidota bacterium]
MQDRPILDMQLNLDDFFQTGVYEIMDQINGGEQPLWGMMTVHHMLEHLVLPLNFALGTFKVPVFMPEEKIPRQREFLFSVYGLPKNFKAPFLPADKNMPLMTKDLTEAKSLLKETIEKFLASINSPGFNTETHPVFGHLNRGEWLIFQYKHFSHHFMQFGLMPIATS